jgi:hypothetical protein
MPATFALKRVIANRVTVSWDLARSGSLPIAINPTTGEIALAIM